MPVGWDGAQTMGGVGQALTKHDKNRLPQATSCSAREFLSWMNKEERRT